MKSFFDTSSLVKKYIEETGSDTVTELFQNSDEVVLSPITRIEVIRKYGLRSLDGIQLASAKISNADQLVTSDTKHFSHQ